MLSIEIDPYAIKQIEQIHTFLNGIMMLIKLISVTNSAAICNVL